jgi:hypothetical protein
MTSTDRQPDNKGQARSKAPNADIRDTQIKPTAGVWACQHCGRRIQVITESEHEKLQPYICVCGTPMEPGEEHSVLPEAIKSDVVDA